MGGRFGWKDWNKELRVRDASVTVTNEWNELEEIEFSRLSKLRMDVDTQNPETLFVPSLTTPYFILIRYGRSSHGFLYEYDKTYDKINTKNEKPLQSIDRIRYNPTTSDDPIIQDVSPSHVVRYAELTL